MVLENRRLICQLWASVCLLLIGISFFAISAINRTFLFGGIAFVLAACINMFVYFLCIRHERKDNLLCFENGKCKCGEFCHMCCDSCMRVVFCLESRRDQTLRQATNDSVMHVQTNSLMMVFGPELRVRLRSIENDVIEIYTEITRVEAEVERQSEGTPSRRYAERDLTQIKRSLSQHYDLLSSWIENHHVVAEADLVSLRSSIHTLRARLWELLHSGNHR